jgi:hypothetical protein
MPYYFRDCRPLAEACPYGSNVTRNTGWKACATEDYETPDVAHLNTIGVEAVGAVQRDHAIALVIQNCRKSRVRLTGSD